MCNISYIRASGAPELSRTNLCVGDGSCEAPYLFRNHLSLTSNTAEFEVWTSAHGSQFTSDSTSECGGGVS